MDSYGFGCAFLAPVTALTVIGVLCFMPLLCLTPSRMSMENCLFSVTGLRYYLAMARKKTLPPQALEYFAEMGRQGGLLGGHARAANMTPAQRSASAKKASQARWGRAKGKRDGG